jgi:hypothetical protein
MSFPEYKILVVEWEDHTGDSAWLTTDEVKKQKPALAKTIGYVIHEDDKTIKLADTLLDDGDVGGISLILKSTIKKRKGIKLSTRKKRKSNWNRHPNSKG